MPAHVIVGLSQRLTQRPRGRSRGIAACAAALGALAAVAVPASPAQAAATTWSVATSPNRSNSNELASVSCTSAKWCVAVGEHTGGSGSGPYRTLAESWNGKAWSLVAIPNASGSDNVLTGVSCASPKSCVAVGYYGGAQLLAESWNGNTWKVTSPPNPSTYDAFNGVSCASATSCVAVGYANVQSGSSTSTETVAESWNGSSWKVLPSQNPGDTYSLFGGVSCASPSSCVAVGSQFDGVSEFPSLVESWNGSSWKVVASPSPGANNFLAGVSCVSSTRCVAAGQTTTGGLTTTLIASLKNGSWKLAGEPNPGTTSDEFNGVSCASSSSCVAVGAAVSGPVTDTLIETLTGGSWKVTTSPDPGSSYNTLGGVSCPATASCAAAGSYGSPDSSKTLIESTF